VIVIIINTNKTQKTLKNSQLSAKTHQKKPAKNPQKPEKT
jgi:hypothetical protein